MYVCMSVCHQKVTKYKWLLLPGNLSVNIWWPVKIDKSRVTGQEWMVKSDRSSVICQEWLDMSDNRFKLYRYQMVEIPRMAGQKRKDIKEKFQEYKRKI